MRRRPCRYTTQHTIGNASHDSNAPPRLVEIVGHALIITANGNKLTHVINGQTMIEVVDHQVAKRASEGTIALQLHKGPAMVVEFKDIQLKRLPAGKVLTPDETPIPEGAKKVK